MNTFDIFVGAFLALAVRDTINYFVARYESTRRRKQMQILIDQLEDMEADDDE